MNRPSTSVTMKVMMADQKGERMAVPLHTGATTGQTEAALNSVSVDGRGWLSGQDLDQGKRPETCCSSGAAGIYGRFEKNSAALTTFEVGIESALRLQTGRNWAGS